MLHGNALEAGKRGKGPGPEEEVLSRDKLILGKRGAFRVLLEPKEITSRPNNGD
jgi:hypothetical protein